MGQGNRADDVYCWRDCCGGQSERQRRKVGGRVLERGEFSMSQPLALDADCDGRIRSDLPELQASCEAVVSSLVPVLFHAVD
eukprot:1347100-Rhodomonas_salina.1